MKKKITALLLALMMGLSAAGCGATGDSDSSADTASADSSGELRQISVVLDWYPNALHTFLYTAIERGYFADEGLDVQIRFPANDNDAITLVAAGQADIGLYYEHDAIQAVADQGAEIRSIGAVVQSPLNVILALEDKNIITPADLEGRTVGYGGTALSEALVRTMMAADGADPENVKLVNVGFELMSAMTTDSVDATIGCLVNHEVPELEEEGFSLTYFPVSGYGIPNYYEEVFLASNEMIADEPEVLAGFLRACERGFEDFKADPEGCLQILLDNQNEENFPLSPTVEAQSADTLLPLMETEDAAFLSQTAENWQENIDWMYEAGLISNTISPEDVMAEIDY